MKTFQLFLLTMAISAGSVLKAETLPSTALSNEVYQLLQNLPLEVEEEVVLNVKFTFNDQNELVVLSVEAEDPYLRSLIKKRLNYKKMQTVLDSSIKEYHLPVRIKV